MNTFFVFQNKDSANAYVDALLSAGFEQVKKLNQAVFILYDVESVGRRWEIKREFLKEKIGFIYPHTPLTCYIWDGIYAPLPVACNFVAGDGAKQCMKSYGYPYRVESCGFPRCRTLPFQFSRGRHLLFVPARPRRDHGKQAELDRLALHWIIEHSSEFETITICRLAGQFHELDDLAIDIKKFRVLTTNPKETTSPAQDMIDRIDRSDVVVAAHTPAALAIARGKPTLMYGQGDSLETLNGKAAKNYHKYKSLYDYPLDLLDMTLDDVKNFAYFGCHKVEAWKQSHIGGNFDSEKFLSIVREYV